MGPNSLHAKSFIEYHHLYNVIGFAVNEQYKAVDVFENLPVFTLENLYNEVGSSNIKVFVSLLWNHLNRDRRNMYEFCKSKGYQMANLISPLSVIRSEITGDNMWIQDFAVIQNGCVLGSNIAMMQSTVIGTRCHIGSHCFFGAHSIVGGGSSVGEQTFVGFNATVFDGTRIGSKCIVGACTVVKRNMPDCSKIITSSDFTIKQYAEDEVENKLMFSKNKR